MNRLTVPCNRRNYGGSRSGAVDYIVVHYTAGDGDTAKGNGNYFSREVVQASAHWFVDEKDAVLSVPEGFVAWHCGGAVYRHPECRNANSIGIEICSRKDKDGVYYFTDEAVENAADLTRELMKKYNVHLDNVVRHYDVTGKICPAPFVGAGAAEWKEFKELLMAKRYNELKEAPVWAQPTLKKLIEKNFLTGDGAGLDLSHDMVRLLVIQDRAGMFDK